MEIIKNKTMDQERALYGLNHIMVDHCAFDGPQDGESAIKECSDVTINDTYFNLSRAVGNSRLLVSEMKAYELRISPYHVFKIKINK